MEIRNHATESKIQEQEFGIRESGPEFTCQNPKSTDQSLESMRWNHEYLMYEGGGGST